MPAMTFDQYKQKLTEEAKRIETSNEEIKNYREHKQSPLNNRIRRIIDDYKADFVPANRPRFRYADSFDLRIQECQYLSAHIFRSLILDSDIGLILALSFITRSAPKVGYWFSGAQYKFQQDLDEAIKEYDKEASIDIDVKASMNVNDIANIRRREADALRLAHEFISAPNAVDGEGNENKRTLAAVLEARGLPEEVTKTVSLAMIMKSEKDRAALQAGFQRERTQFQAQLVLNDAKRVEEIKRITTKHAEDMKSMDAKYNAETTALRSQVVKMGTDHAREMDKIKEEHKKDMDDLKKLIRDFTANQNNAKNSAHPSAPPSPGAASFGSGKRRFP